MRNVPMLRLTYRAISTFMGAAAVLIGVYLGAFEPHARSGVQGSDASMSAAMTLGATTTTTIAPSTPEIASAAPAVKAPPYGAK